MSTGPEEGPVVRISRASVVDLSKIEALARRIWPEVYPEIISERQIEYMLKRMYDPAVMEKEMTADGVVYLLIHDGSAPFGFASFGPAESEGEIFLHKLYLDPGFHGRGIGSAALARIEAMAREEHGANRIVLRVNRENRKAIAAYLRNGFENTGTVCSDIGDGFVMDDFWMRKEIGE